MANVKLTNYYGKKDSMLPDIMRMLPGEFTIGVETCGGTCTVATNILKGMNLKKIVVIEKDKGMATFLKVVQNNSVGLYEELKNSEYCMEEYEEAECFRGDNNLFTGCPSVKIAAAVYKIINFSFNSVSKGNNYRAIENEGDMESTLLNMKTGRRYKNDILKNIILGSEGLQGINIIEGDMFDNMDFWKNPECFIFCDPPYRPDLRTAKTAYSTDWKESLHNKLCEEIEKLEKCGQLKAKVMICGYVEKDLTQDLYCKKLLRLGFTLYQLKETHLPTINSPQCKRKKKTEAMECVWINYQPIGPECITEDRIFTYEKVFGKG